MSRSGVVFEIGEVVMAKFNGVLYKADIVEYISNGMTMN